MVEFQRHQIQFSLVPQDSLTNRCLKPHYFTNFPISTLLRCGFILQLLTNPCAYAYTFVTTHCIIIVLSCCALVVQSYISFIIHPLGTPHEKGIAQQSLGMRLANRLTFYLTQRWKQAQKLCMVYHVNIYILQFDCSH